MTPPWPPSRDMYGIVVRSVRSAELSEVTARVPEPLKSGEEVSKATFMPPLRILEARVGSLAVWAAHLMYCVAGELWTAPWMRV